MWCCCRPLTTVSHMATIVASGVVDGVMWRVSFDERARGGTDQGDRLYVQRGDATLAISLSRLRASGKLDGQAVLYWFLTESEPHIFVASVNASSERAVMCDLAGGSARELKIVRSGSKTSSLALVADHLQFSTGVLTIEGPGFCGQTIIEEAIVARNVSRSEVSGRPIFDL